MQIEVAQQIVRLFSEHADRLSHHPRLLAKLHLSYYTMHRGAAYDTDRAIDRISTTLQNLAQQVATSANDASKLNIARIRYVNCVSDETALLGKVLWLICRNQR